jgi:hypothetical protein
MNDYSLTLFSLAKEDSSSLESSPFEAITLDRNAFKNYVWLEHVSKVLLNAESDLDRLSEMVAQCNKKWKEALKLVPMKLGLLADALSGYQLPYTPVSFFYTVAVCGAWHPVAHTTFSQHWNDQGISRLRVGIDMACETVLRTLKLKMLPIATNVHLGLLELRGMLAAARAEGLFASVNAYISLADRLIRCSDLLLQKLDDACAEADRAKSGLSLFLQFIKEYHTACSSTTDTAVPAPDVSTMEAYMRLFDPREARARETTKQAPSAGVGGSDRDDSSSVKFPPPVKSLQAEGEAVCGTHLYAYLSEVSGIDVIIGFCLSVTASVV